MQSVSIRTLVLLVELLVAVIVHQYITVATPPRAGATWLAGEGTAVQQTCSDCTNSLTSM